MKWEDLSFRERAEIIKTGVSNGLKDIDSIKDAYTKFAEDSSYNAGNLTNTLYNHFKVENLGKPQHNYNFAQSDEWADAHGYYPDSRGHRNDAVKKESHPTHPSRGTFVSPYQFELSDKGLENSNYTLFGLADGGQDSQATMTYKGSTVLPELTVTPNESYINNPYDNLKLYADGGTIQPDNPPTSNEDDIYNLGYLPSVDIVAKHPLWNHPTYGKLMKTNKNIYNHRNAIWAREMNHQQLGKDYLKAVLNSVAATAAPMTGAIPTLIGAGASIYGGVEAVKDIKQNDLNWGNGLSLGLSALGTIPMNRAIVGGIKTMPKPDLYKILPTKYHHALNIANDYLHKDTRKMISEARAAGKYPITKKEVLDYYRQAVNDKNAGLDWNANMYKQLDGFNKFDELVTSRLVTGNKYYTEIDPNKYFEGIQINSPFISDKNRIYIPLTRERSNLPTSGAINLKATAAHEGNHTIQDKLKNFAECKDNMNSRIIPKYEIYTMKPHIPYDETILNSDYFTLNPAYNSTDLGYLQPKIFDINKYQMPKNKIALAWTSSPNEVWSEFAGYRAVNNIPFNKNGYSDDVINGFVNNFADRFMLPKNEFKKVVQWGVANQRANGGFLNPDNPPSSKKQDDSIVNIGTLPEVTITPTHHSTTSAKKKSKFITTGNELGDAALGMIPILGSVMEWENVYHDPSLLNIGSALFSTACDLAGIGLINKGFKAVRALSKMKKAKKAIDEMEQTREVQKALRQLENVRTGHGYNVGNDLTKIAERRLDKLGYTEQRIKYNTAKQTYDDIMRNQSFFRQKLPFTGFIGGLTQDMVQMTNAMQAHDKEYIEQNPKINAYGGFLQTKNI